MTTKYFPKYDTRVGSDGFYNAEGDDKILISSIASEYNIPLSDISKRYNISESILRKSTVGDVANKYGVSVSSALNELRSMAKKRKNWLEQLAGGLSGMNNINTPVDPPQQNVIPQKETSAFKILNMNGYAVLGVGAIVVTGLILIGTKVFKQQTT